MICLRNPKRNDSDFDRLFDTKINFYEIILEVFELLYYPIDSPPMLLRLIFLEISACNASECAALVP